MPRKSVQSNCKSPTCGAAYPTVHSYNFSSLPENVQEKLKELKLERETLKRCSYAAAFGLRDSMRGHLETIQ